MTRRTNNIFLLCYDSLAWRIRNRRRAPHSDGRLPVDGFPVTAVVSEMQPFGACSHFQSSSDCRQSATSATRYSRSAALRHVAAVSAGEGGPARGRKRRRRPPKKFARRGAAHHLRRRGASETDTMNAVAPGSAVMTRARPRRSNEHRLDLPTPNRTLSSTQEGRGPLHHAARCEMGVSDRTLPPLLRRCGSCFPLLFRCGVVRGLTPPTPNPRPGSPRSTSPRPRAARPASLFSSPVASPPTAAAETTTMSRTELHPSSKEQRSHLLRHHSLRSARPQQPRSISPQSARAQLACNCCWTPARAPPPGTPAASPRSTRAQSPPAAASQPSTSPSPAGGGPAPAAPPQMPLRGASHCSAPPARPWTTPAATPAGARRCTGPRARVRRRWWPLSPPRGRTSTPETRRDVIPRPFLLSLSLSLVFCSV